MKSVLSSDKLPAAYYNIQHDLPEPLPPPLDPRTMQPMAPEPLLRLFAKECVMQEVSTQEFIPIPDEVREAYLRLGRPTPLHRAARLEAKLKTPAKIFYKREDLNPAGSHKPNTAIAQAYYHRKEGTERLTTETGAGQWGSALALAAAMFDIDLTVYMTRSSYEQKPYRRTLMEVYGAEVHSSPSSRTSAGRKFLEKDPNHPGGLGIAISEAVEDCITHDNTKYALGSVLNHVLTHQSVIGQEAKLQMEEFGEDPDYIVGCIGGGSNYAGLAYPFMKDKLRGKSDAEFVASEPKAVPSTTRGSYRYDFADSGEMTPLIKMHTVGHTYQCPPIHAGGLRYHGKAPSMCMLIDKGFMRSVSYSQNEVMEAGVLMAQTEGIVPAPESNHAVKAAIDLALRCKQKNEAKTILFNLSGHGLLDLKAYEDKLANRLVDFEPDEGALAQALAALPVVR
ncbi:MAG: TrpB-like pyridoxal phosphate-dependent enzyme [Nitrososphaerota archaeon]|nr:TrpB-like pyridoxal phosphate-dependent enzyme [Nitrososphaerota archaeon]MCL5672772.1 TrpB-like pyridoxal phosphate-dependent enzyme [Nitrososphaerota archaeon]MDG6912522.1 TrpB-like pyridoxal phosphate-dependent enzyme [Nitrososphaerota archaeon]MDG6936952.1 TrpB-like pyridoxal phosphate-dependent enzyme [Nitrososphaerota archaeon]MDG6945434.1 TrpB-like pyridoxal phosphate-dependent enzyme [Nitrososphaerota archaeon]